MDPIPVRDEDYDELWNLQKSIQIAHLANDGAKITELGKEMTDKIYELYPQCAGHKVRFDVSARKIFIWE
jgi:hypothetical protein